VAIIMDGNGRWASRRRLPRFAGHKRGVDAVRRTVQACVERGIEYLTLFAFSSENWRRPAEEVSLLMQLFHGVLSGEIQRLHRNGIRLKVVGDTSRFDAGIRSLIESGETLTRENRTLTLTVAANYGGRWDVLQALSRLAREHPEAVAQGLREDALAPYLSMAYAPEPDLFIRISNFLLWQLAYSELYFTDTLWPDFGAQALDAAILSYGQRERRFGRTSEQLQEELSKETAAGGSSAASAHG
jgi:undecaprenyl diphosphate synthase